MEQTLLEKEQTVLGPFLCKAQATSMGFWISLGIASSKANFAVVVGASDGKGIPFEPLKDSIFGVLMAQVTGLIPGTRYVYKIQKDGIDWLPPGLKAEDLFFTTLPQQPQELEFVLMSCHGIEAYSKDPKQKNTPFHMWDQLLDYLDKNPSCALGILGGDQVYMDDTFGEDISKFKNDKSNAPRRAHEAYVKYWQEPVYRKVMARLPTFLMWDDHDLIDGWGSREEAAGSSTWSEYGALLTQAFSEMQASRNMGVIDPESGFSFKNHIGRSCFIALDLRKGRRILDAKSSEMMSGDHRLKLEETFANIDGENTDTLFIVSPVTVARIGGPIESLLGGVANFFWSLGRRISHGKSPLRVLFWFLMAAVWYFGLHLNTPTAPGIAQAGLLIVSSILLLCNWNNVNRYFPKKHLPIHLGFIALLIVGLSYFIYALNQASSWAVIKTALCRALESSFGESVSGILLFAAALFSLGIWKSKIVAGLGKSRWVTGGQGFAKWFGVILFLGFTLFNLWRGWPGWKVSWEMGMMVILYAMLQIVVLFYMLIAILEALGAVDEVAGLDDDIRDGWSSEANRRDLEWLSKMIVSCKERGLKNIVLLCGDIHTGGLSLIKFYANEKKCPVYQVTSSPMSYVTMPPLVEKLTSGSEEFGILTEKDVKICDATNIFFRSQRNFAILKTGVAGTSVSFHFEDMEAPVKLML